MLLAHYQQTPRTPELVEGYVTLMTGKPVGVVSGLVHPETGIVGRCKFLPSIAEVKDWIYKQLSHDQREAEHKQALLNPPTEEYDDLPKEERERRYRVLQNLKGVLAGVVAEKDVSEELRQRTPEDNQRALQALKNMQSLDTK